jgi:hypothetical protein
VIVIPLAMAPNIIGPNYKNVTVWTHVNITNSRPEVLNVTVYDSDNSSRRNVTLNAGMYKNVTCNVTIRDWNGYPDISNVNATLWHFPTSTFGSSDNNNTHYTNTNCTDSGNGLGFIVNYLCYFEIIYYANNGTWMCNSTVIDNQSSTNYGNGSTIFYPVYALNVTDGIDYGSLAVEDFSGNVTANITNLGNMAINVTVEGYGGRKGDGLAMNCSLWGNITVANERFSTQQDADWALKIPLNGSAQFLPNLTIMKQNDSNLVVNSTYWQLYVDSANVPGGNCTGYVIFTAIAS